ncbi:hypothetical protein LPJ64_001403 [Coemansia asiatica]|uniref:Uncharacterized protein n=1 Tax=Coemansia asiatica TaxID=1052880 RepID=A0A9W7XQ44_9FUNG|nr:hypothetical protein LPJ64_001403 [Coemansia asiatica]KAJ2855910.1 hypothetical protein FB639_006175 [Coemansia asiatica]
MNGSGGNAYPPPPPSPLGSSNSHRGRYLSHHRGGHTFGAPGRGRGHGSSGSMGRGRGRGSLLPKTSGVHTNSINPTNNSISSNSGNSSSINSNSSSDHGKPGGTGHLVPVRPSGPTPVSTTSWRVLYVVPTSARTEVGPSGEKLPGPFSPPLRPATPEKVAGRKPQDVLRKQNEVFAMKQRVQQLLQQAANSPVGSLGTYVGKISYQNNSIIPVLPRPETL